jgi:Zn-dependent protease with chaperone function
MATDFFDRQDSARRQTGRLVVLFAFSVVLIIAAVYAVATAAVVAGSRPAPGQHGPPLFTPDRFAVVVTSVLLVITTGTLYKLAVLREGGDAVARMLGGHPIDPGTTEPSERRLLNVVEEMALASGTPVPPVYLLPAEHSINAFAAGFTPGDAVIGVSRGSLDHLTRDELQGVIGHEFSHILNGDMRLNLRLIGLVHGILVIALIGQLIVRLVLDSNPRSSSRTDSDSKDSGWAVFAMLAVGAGLWVIGSLGVLLGRVIKCAISRQREYLADASSVQFTRDPEGLCGALKKIGGLSEGSKVKNVNAEQACHMFFGQGVASFSRLLATHPPLAERILALDPSFNGTLPRVAPGRVVTAAVDEEEVAGVSAFSVKELNSTAELVPVDPDSVIATVGNPTLEHVGYASGLIGALPLVLADSSREPYSARAVVYALLLDDNEAVCRTQLEHLDEHEAPGTVAAVLRLRPAVNALGKESRIPLTDLTFPALRRLSQRQYRVFRSNVDTLVKADSRVSLFEYALQRMLLRHLDRAFFRLPPPIVRYNTLDPVFGDCTVLLSTLARLGHTGALNRVEDVFEAGMARLQSRYPGERLTRLLPPERCSLAAVERSLDRLAKGSPSVKKRVLDACAASIAFDGVMTLGEAELLRAIADSLDCPIPPFLARQAINAPIPMPIDG